MHTRTWQFPRLGLVEIDDGDDLELDLEVVDLALEVVADELVVGGVEAEPGRQGHGAHYSGRDCSNMNVHLQAMYSGRSKRYRWNGMEWNGTVLLAVILPGK